MTKRTLSDQETQLVRPIAKNGKVTITKTKNHRGSNKEKVLKLPKSALTPVLRAGLKAIVDAKFGITSLFFTEMYE